METEAGKTEMVKEPLTDTKPEAEVKTKPESDSTVKPEDFQKTQDELDKVRKALKDANKEAADRRKRLDELEAAEAKRKEAEMTETEKLQAQIKQLADEKTDLLNKQKETERRELQRKVAKDVGLPEGLAARLRGDTEEEMTDDAKIVLELMPKLDTTPEKKTAPKLAPMNPGDGKQGETPAMRRARLLGKQVNVWDADLAKLHGGGAEFKDTQE